MIKSTKTKQLGKIALKAMKAYKASIKQDRDEEFNNYFSSINLKPRVYPITYTNFSKVK